MTMTAQFAGGFEGRDEDVSSRQTSLGSWSLSLASTSDGTEGERICSFEYLTVSVVVEGCSRFTIQ
ncbi:hypothetical protein JYU34_004811 [Plutella xylostella]|uniref:Uncharacterized protein n=1 Tax=Plutella xylostella TaxID=51655 RepID=A0ABQ7QYX5_PLUXY|nr:hypothetical protein JYU34_004811 [Plutella xylostella]